MTSFPIVAYLSDTSVLVSEIYFPAVTICPDFMPFLAIRRSYDYNIMDKYHRFERHTGRRYYYEDEEYFNETIDEELTQMSYLDVLDKIENFEINPKDLGLKM
jgi:hypothetical protein